MISDQPNDFRSWKKRVMQGKYGDYGNLYVAYDTVSFHMA